MNEYLTKLRPIDKVFIGVFIMIFGWTLPGTLGAIFSFIGGFMLGFNIPDLFKKKKDDLDN